MKDTKQIIEELINVQIGYYNDRKEIRRYLDDQPVVLAMLESYTKRIERIRDIIVEDILEISDVLDKNNKYMKENWIKTVAKTLIDHTVTNNGEYKDSTIEMLVDWENMGGYAEKVETHRWFYDEELLEEHSKGFPAYQKKLEEVKKEKKEKTKKETA